MAEVFASKIKDKKCNSTAINSVKAVAEVIGRKYKNLYWQADPILYGKRFLTENRYEW